jgi:preprotein translocase subunit SecF
MEFFKPGRVYDFMGQAPRWFLVSAIVCGLALISLIYPGPKWGTDFAGGTEIQITFEKNVSDVALRRALNESGYQDAEIVPVGGNARGFIIRMKSVSPVTPAEAKAAETAVRSQLRSAEMFVFRMSPGGDKLTLQFAKDVTAEDIQRVLTAAKLEVREVRPFGKPEEHRFEVYLTGIGEAVMQGLRSKLPEGSVPAEAERIEWVGPKAGAQLRDAGLKAILYAVGLMALYIAFRFDMRFAPGAVLALIHDVLVALMVLVLARREITLTTVAAILTIVGFSINDTIVVYDRIRENFGKMRERDLGKMINVSISETLSRTINTTMTVQISVVSIMVFTTGTVFDFALTLFVGFLTGVYSSVFIASPITVWFDKKIFRRAAAAA